jgi:endogenous inhibitor of DNA gyrase (YacG/DUF329 family)
MGAFNTVSIRLKCPSCGIPITMPVQYKYGDTWQLNYELGDIIKWGGNDEGERGHCHVVVDGIATGKCPECGHDNERDIYVHIENDRIAGVENADGRFDFAKAVSNYIILD